MSCWGREFQVRTSLDELLNNLRALPNKFRQYDAWENMQTKLKKSAEGVSKQRKLVEAPNFKENSSSAVQEEEHKKLAEFEAQQSNYEKTIQQFETMKLGR